MSYRMTGRFYVYRHWRGRPGTDAMRVGAAYGLSRVGCCWALMLVMFGLGTMSVAWMLGVGAVTAVGGTRGSAEAQRPARRLTAHGCGPGHRGWLRCDEGTSRARDWTTPGERLPFPRHA